MQEDTIFALSTPPGKSGVAVIRISGVQAEDMLMRLSRRPTLPEPRMATLANLFNGTGDIIDRALILYFKAPHSFTGEDVVELHVHGGRAVIQAVLKELAAHPGLRVAEPGEFMRRAFFAGKKDLLETEAIADMIDAETAAQLRQASKQMLGYQSAFFKTLRESVIEILALLEAYIDFPEEDIPENVLSEVTHNIARLAEHIEGKLKDGRAGERLRSGYRISIIGAPNVGKSTLLNALAKRDAAIVSAQAGTTRDVIELEMDIDGFPVILCDTAGVREVEDEVERIGIERAYQSMAMADIILLVLDATRSRETLEQAVELVRRHGGHTCLLVVNKSDEVSPSQLSKIEAECRLHVGEPGHVVISAKSGKGLAELEASVAALLTEMLPKEDVLITHGRHRQLLVAAHQHLLEAKQDLPLELWCEELRLAATSIGKITGEIRVDDLLDVIFSRFCIGK